MSSFIQNDDAKDDLSEGVGETAAQPELIRRGTLNGTIKADDGNILSMDAFEN